MYQKNYLQEAIMIVNFQNNVQTTLSLRSIAFQNNKWVPVRFNQIVREICMLPLQMIMGNLQKFWRDH